MENWDADIIKIIRTRKSVRTYDGRPLTPAAISKMEAFFPVAEKNPFDARVRLSIIKTGEQGLGTYGFIKGAKTFFGGCVKKGGLDLEGFGYSFEKTVLFATAKGFGTCWLGGTYRRSCANKLLLPDGEYLPAVSPIGAAADKKTITERAVAAGANAYNRKRFGELFFDGDFSSPLKIDDCALKTCLEMVRLAPSASNRQPWRVIVADGACHFYIRREKSYAGNTLYGFCMQRIDLGIAACHFELTAKQTGLPGGIVRDDPGILSGKQKRKGLCYSFTWR